MPGQAVTILDKSRLFAACKRRLADKQFELHAVGSLQRNSLERYIAKAYDRVHQANIVEFMPMLLEMRAAALTEAAVGLRPGCFRPLFLEQYLDSPIEQQVAGLSTAPVSRAGLVEVGNLVVTRKGAGFQLFTLLASTLFDAGFTWMVFTATEEVERIMLRMGFQPHCLMEADPAKLSGNAADWGRYYQCRPKVMVGNLAIASQLINSSSALSELLLNYNQSRLSLSHSLADFRRQSQWQQQ